MSTNGVPGALRRKGIGVEAVKALAAFKEEPGWLREKRLAAWRTFEEIPMPTMRDEAWRYTDVSDVRFEEYVPYAPSPDVEREGDLPDAVQRLIKEGEENSALLVQHNSETTYTRIDEELRAKGVVFTDLHTALREHEELVRERLFRLVPEDYDKFAALSAAAFSGGSFLYVPRGVEVEVPIQSYRWLDVAGSIMPRTLVIIEEGASVTYIDEYASDDGEEPALSNGAVELFVGQGARLQYVSLQNWARNVVHFNTIRSQAEKDATINSLVVSFGAQLSRTNVEAGLTAPGSDSEMLGLYFADEDQLIDHHTLQDHIAPQAHSDLLYKGALRDESLTVFSGLIRVEPGAQKTDAYQTNRNLILGTDEAMAVSLPNLEIMADDVKCSHGATTGQVDDLELFYLMSRGIPRVEAEKLVVFGFFGEVTSRIPLKGLRAKLDRAIEEKIGLGFEERVA
ncbi:Fe-S cluster assembly protein SufD [Rubrobacter xylanophilus]|uniref:Fe-S cluster assembly protein SufD n=1 Tax=Rubrobacter xylanophilus TaxID=49319 RepID=A0A510HNU5_9ACTN|nr:Fe-S cluster assembly protein SufD [Rubrobacter xylanophilus]BBL80307.1 Fe-S cluster assembly protein SufD [Rubrobacter xylanophilus]